MLDRVRAAHPWASAKPRCNARGNAARLRACSISSASRSITANPLGRPLKVAELASLLRAAPDHLRLLLMILIGTACRPEAALELGGEQLDFDDRLIDLNGRGRKQTKKFRPVVKLPEKLASFLAGAPFGPLVTFRGQPVRKINKAWRALRQAAGLDDTVNPYSIRHTVARWMRQSGVPAWEVWIGVK